MDTSTRETLIGLGAAIQKKREELAALERQFDSLAASGSTSLQGTLPTVAPLSAGMKISVTNEALVSSDASLPQKIMARIRLQPDRTYGADDFKDLAGEAKMQSLRSALMRLYDDGKGSLERPGRGQYRLKGGGVKQLFPASAVSR